MSLFYVKGQPTNGPDDWKWGLKHPQRQWKPGFSAWMMAHTWEASQGFPAEIQAVLQPVFPEIEIVKGLVEHTVPLKGGGGQSGCDLWALAKTQNTPISIAVEGKVIEPFGKILEKWIDGTPNRDLRLASILDCLELPRDIPGTIRYQLLHRAAAPILEAERLQIPNAVIIIHSFSPKQKHFADYQAFLNLYGVNGQPGELIFLKQINHINLYAGWAQGNSIVQAKASPLVDSEGQ